MNNAEFLIVLGPPLLASVGMLWHLRRLRKHDKVLYEFCQTRRDLMELLRNNNYDLKRQDYIALRELSQWMDFAIHHFNDVKGTMFNGRRVMEEIKTVKRVSIRIQRKTIENEEVGRLYHQFGHAVISGFLAFTPFLKSEIVLRLLPFLVRVLAKAGVKYFKENRQKIGESISWLSEQKRSVAYS